MKRLIGPILAVCTRNLAAVGLALCASTTSAQEGEASPAPKGSEAAPAPSESGSGGAVDQSSFRPSEEVSPDQEVDFPADI